jgi:hypothetical protein
MFWRRIVRNNRHSVKSNLQDTIMAVGGIAPFIYVIKRIQACFYYAWGGQLNSNYIQLFRKQTELRYLFLEHQFQMGVLFAPAAAAAAAAAAEI